MKLNVIGMTPSAYKYSFETGTAILSFDRDSLRIGVEFELYILDSPFSVEVNLNEPYLKSEDLTFTLDSARFRSASDDEKFLKVLTDTLKGAEFRTRLGVCIADKLFSTASIRDDVLERRRVGRATASMKLLGSVETEQGLTAEVYLTEVSRTRDEYESYGYAGDPPLSHSSRKLIASIERVNEAHLSKARENLIDRALDTGDIELFKRLTGGEPIA